MSVVPVLFIFQILDGFSVASGIVISQATDEVVQRHYISFARWPQVQITCFRRGEFQVLHPRDFFTSVRFVYLPKVLLPFEDVHTTNQGYTGVCLSCWCAGHGTIFAGESPATGSYRQV